MNGWLRPGHVQSWRPYHQARCFLRGRSVKLASYGSVNLLSPDGTLQCADFMRASSFIFHEAPERTECLSPRKPLKEGAGILGKGRESDISKCFYVLSVLPPSPITSEKGTEKSEFWCRTSGFEFTIQLLCDSGQVVSPLWASVSFPKETRHPSSWVVAKN